MRIAVFDPFCGVSGNMILGALLDAGLDLDLLTGMLQNLNLKGWELSAEKALKNSLQGILVTVSIPTETTARNLDDILGIISGSDLPDTVRIKSSDAFRTLAEAESAAHGIPVDQVHFHETGAMDAMIDIIGSFCGLYLLGIDRIFSSPVATGTGTLECSHGILPVPAPATMYMLKDVPISPSGINCEISTPTGTAILVTAVESWETPPAMIPRATGMGAGSKDLSRPNLLRLTVGDTDDDALWNNDNCIEMKTIIDDMDARIWPDAAGSILKSGALDCYAAMCIGRKGRPAVEVTVICHVSDMNEVIESLFRNTPTLGVRLRLVERAVLERDFFSVETEFGTVSVKRAFLDGKQLRAEPEYEDCAKASRQHNIPVSKVLEAARSAISDNDENG